MKTKLKLINTHAETDECKKHGCCVHNITKHHMRHWPQHWRGDRQMMERICPHGIGHPDPDHMAWYTRKYGKVNAHYEGIHGCDGCCTPYHGLD